MPEDEMANEVLGYLRELSKNLITSEIIHEEISQFRAEAREDQKEIIADLKEQSKEIDGIQIEIINLKHEIANFKVEVEPIIQLKETIQKQVIKYTSIAFVAIMGDILVINQLCLS